MSLQAGTQAALTVMKESRPYGFFVSDGNREVLLHYTETEGEVKPGDTVDVFLYYDTEDRLAATMKKPLIRLGEVALLEVADIHPRFGSFLDMGLGRQLLLPFKEQPELSELRPAVGDKVFVTLAHDRQGRLIAKLAGEEELAPLTFHAPDSWMNQWLEARVYKPLQMGTFVICGAGVLGFGAIGLIHGTERTRLLRAGETLEVRVTHVREDGRVNLSMRPAKEVGREQDAERILDVLRQRPNASMPYSDETPADIIAQRFGISKSAFKRALGKLMREGIVTQEGSWTHLKKDADTGSGGDCTSGGTGDAEAAAPAAAAAGPGGTAETTAAPAPSPGTRQGRSAKAGFAHSGEADQPAKTDRQPPRADRERK